MVFHRISQAKPRDHLINCLLVDGTEITTGSQIADKFNKYFTGIAQELVDKLPQPTRTTVNLGFPYPTSFAIFPTSPEEVIEMGHLMKVTSSSGHDDINPTLVGPLLHLVAEPLAVIFNSSFNTGIVPNLLKSAIVTPIYKQGLRNEVSNYRPISILPYFSKLLEKSCTLVYIVT